MKLPYGLAAIVCLCIGVVIPLSIDKHKTKVLKEGGSFPMALGMAGYGAGACLIGLALVCARKSLAPPPEPERKP